MNSDLWFALGLFVIGVGMIVGAMPIEAPFSHLGDPGPRILPISLGIGLAAMGILLLLRSPRPAAAKIEGSSEPLEGTGGTVLPPPPMPVRIGIVAAVIVYVLLFQPLGFTLSTFAFLTVAIALLGPPTARGVVAAMIAAAVTSLAVGAFLTAVIGVPLPGVLVP